MSALIEGSATLTIVESMMASVVARPRNTNAVRGPRSSAACVVIRNPRLPGDYICLVTRYSSY